jgi:acetate kinase
MATTMGGLDVIAFTGGVGENAPEIRRATLDRIGFLGAALDPEANETARSDADVSPAGWTVRTVVVEAREDIEITREVHRVLRRYDRSQE